MSAHTPGPWQYLDIGEIVREDDMSITVATLNEGAGVSFDEANANAALLTAAPEMFQALSSARIILQAFRVSGEGGLDTMIEQIDLALSKARP